SDNQLRLEQPFVVESEKGIRFQIATNCDWAVRVLDTDRDQWRNWIDKVRKLSGPKGVSVESGRRRMLEGLQDLFPSRPDRQAQVEPAASVLVRYVSLATTGRNPLNARSE